MSMSFEPGGSGQTQQQRERLRKSRKLGLCQKLSVQNRACYLEGQTPFERAQNFDGNYFEKFNSLDRNENHIESQNKEVVREESLDHAEEDEGYDAEVLSSAAAEATLTDKQREALYCELLYTIIHQLGVQNKTEDLSPGELFVYAQESLNISAEKHRNLYAKTKERESPTCMMKVEVVEARHLEAKDANGLSDPYCMLGIMTEEIEAEKMKKIKVHRKKSRTVREVLGEESIHVTQVKENTLNPVWNETFTMKVTNSYRERFHLDIWDCDDKAILKEGADNKLSKIKGISGVGRFFKDVMQSARKSTGAQDGSIDDFLGFVEIPLKNLPSSGIDQWFKLEGRSSKSRVDGDCHLKITLTTGKRPDIPDEIKHLFPTAIDIHGAFLREFIKYSGENCQEPSNKRSSDQLCPQAEFILRLSMLYKMN